MYSKTCIYSLYSMHTVYSIKYFKVNESINSNMSNALLMASTKSLKINKAKEPKEKSSRMQLKQFTFDQSSVDEYLIISKFKYRGCLVELHHGHQVKTGNTVP